MRAPRLLVPTDFSACAAGALKVADALAVERGGTLHLLHVHVAIEAAVMDFSYVQPNERPTAAVHDLQLQLQAWTQQLRTPPERRRLEVALGNPVAEIVARSHHADLAVLGTHGRSGLGLFLLGSVTERVVRHAACSVYVVKESVPHDA